MDQVFASLYKEGMRPYWPALKNHLRPVAAKAEVKKHIVWHTFRHSIGTGRRLYSGNVLFPQASRFELGLDACIGDSSICDPNHIPQNLPKVSKTEHTMPVIEDESSQGIGVMVLECGESARRTL